MRYRSEEVKLYIITDYDGTFTNTHDVLSGPIQSQDSPHITQLIIELKPSGVFGCTHRGTDGYQGFQRSGSWVSAISGEIAQQKLARIHDRLNAVCDRARTTFYGTSTEYDLDGIFAGKPFIQAAEDSNNEDPKLNENKKLFQVEKNRQLNQIFSYVEKHHPDQHAVFLFFDDKGPIHQALTAAQGLNLPDKFQLLSFEYKFSQNSLGNFTLRKNCGLQIFPIDVDAIFRDASGLIERVRAGLQVCSKDKKSPENNGAASQTLTPNYVDAFSQTLSAQPIAPGYDEYSAEEKLLNHELNNPKKITTATGCNVLRSSALVVGLFGSSLSIASAAGIHASILGPLSCLVVGCQAIPVWGQGLLIASMVLLAAGCIAHCCYDAYQTSHVVAI